MKSAYICINGNLSNIPDLKRIKRHEDILICADGAADFVFQQNIIPDVIIGDLDSISSSVKKYFESKQIKWITYPKEKDNTDADLAIQYALEQKVDAIIIFGLLGNRLDHMFSNVFHLAEIANSIECKILEGDTELYFVRKTITLEGKTGDELSLLPLKEDCEEVTTTGLYYPLQKERLLFGTTRGISNVFKESTVTVTLSKGVLLVTHRQV